jgi:hypothetical protein
MENKQTERIADGGKTMSSIDWLIEKIEGEKTLIARIVGLKEYNKIIQQAKEMHKQEIMYTYKRGFLSNDINLANHYYNLTFNTQNNDN